MKFGPRGRRHGRVPSPQVIDIALVRVVAEEGAKSGPDAATYARQRLHVSWVAT